MATTIRMAATEQSDRTMYVGAMPSRELIRLGKVAEWSEDEKAMQGYQRAPERGRIRKLAKYLDDESDPLLPTSVLLSHRGAPLETTDAGDGMVDVHLPDDEVLWIVDGQHRVAGLHSVIEERGRKEFADFMVPVVIVEFPGIEDEAHQFQVINETMKKVSTALARRLLALRLAKGDATTRREIRHAKRLWEAEAVEVVAALQRDETSPWHGRIQPPNTKKGPTHIVRELSFSTSLKPILNDEVCTDLGTERVTAFLDAYWRGWREVMPEAFEDPKAYVIQKTGGVFALHRVARYLLKVFVFRRMTSPSVDDVRVVLEDAGEGATAQFWEAGNAQGAAMAGNMAGFKIVGDEIVDTLQSNGHVLE